VNGDGGAARRCWAEIDLAAVRHNADALLAQGRGRTQLMAIVKANAYGHGMVPVAHALSDRAAMFGVANVAEARDLHRHLPDASIFILGPALPEERLEIAQSRFIPAISNYDEAAAYDALALNAPVQLHLAIDTGMGRIGVWEEDVFETVEAIRKLRRVVISGVATHLPVADEDAAFTQAQLDRFARLLDALRAHGIARIVDHVENSAGLIAFPDKAGSMVRAGLALYGSAPLSTFQSRLIPVMTWKTRITLVREVGPGRGISYGRTFITPHAMRVATLAVGYADGYRRHLSHHDAEVLVHGQRSRVLGRVTMDQIMIDVTALPSARAGDEVVLLGRQGDHEIAVTELARKAGTIAWDLFTGLGTRVERVYLS
jgi:alanine racemase